MQSAFIVTWSSKSHHVIKLGIVRHINHSTLQYFIYPCQKVQSLFFFDKSLNIISTNLSLSLTFQFHYERTNNLQKHRETVDRRILQTQFLRFYKILQFPVSLIFNGMDAIWKKWLNESESLVTNRKRNQCPRWIGIQQVMALQDPRLYTAHLWILPVPRPARTLPMPLIFASFSAFSSTFVTPPISFRFPFLFILVSPPLSGHVLSRVISCVLLGKVVVPASLSWLETVK